MKSRVVLPIWLGLAFLSAGPLLGQTGSVGWDTMIFTVTSDDESTLRRLLLFVEAEEPIIVEGRKALPRFAVGCRSGATIFIRDGDGNFIPFGSKRADVWLRFKFGPTHGDIHEVEAEPFGEAGLVYLLFGNDVIRSMRGAKRMYMTKLSVSDQEALFKIEGFWEAAQRKLFPKCRQYPPWGIEP